MLRPSAPLNHDAGLSRAQSQTHGPSPPDNRPYNSLDIQKHGDTDGVRMVLERGEETLNLPVIIFNKSVKMEY